MTIHHHPGEDLIFSYAAGVLAESWSIAIASHLSYCPTCRQKSRHADIVGASLLEEVETEPLGTNAVNHVLSLIDGVEQEKIDDRGAPDVKNLASAERSIVPSALQHYVGSDLDNLPWQRLGSDASQYLIETGDDEAKVRLLRIKADRPVPSHGHRGRELTMVLSGSFEDEYSRFGPGDLEDIDEGAVHKPIATSGEDCICLAVTDAPLKFKELVPRLLQPVLKI
ncbi:MAG: transcriptional regulator [Rhodospirillaceae bacterium]|nr:transcriptional regulator [Rhodospirillaceae bacterium]|tara:strand:- start:1247 stop:1921 length:675 start_codon:yes stop_codon:yes gene_type:complete